MARDPEDDLRDDSGEEEYLPIDALRKRDLKCMTKTG